MFEGHRSFKEDLNRHGEKLFRPIRAVSVEYRLATRLDMLNVALVCFDKHALPVSEVLAPAEVRDTVGVARQVVDLVGEFMKHDVVAILVVDGALFGMRPGKNDRTPRPALTHSHRFAFRCDIAFVLCPLRLEGTRIDENRAKMLVPRVAIDDEKAGLRSNRKLHFLVYFQPVAPDELDLVQKGVDLAFELPA